MSAPEVLAVVGPTASGKSDVAMRIVRARRSRGAAPVEIVAADAFTIYRGMDIGTAKPGAADRAAVPHHLIDELDPRTDATVAWFQTRAREVITEIHGRGNVPLLVGGSGLYFRAVVDDLRFPPTDPEVRAAIEARYAGDGPAAYEHLRTLDRDAAAKIEPGNLRRSVRALEVIELTGEPYSAYDDGFDRYDSIYPGLRVRGVLVDRAELRRRIEQRAARMLADGLVDEARRLPRGELSRTARQGIGYAEAFAVIDGELSSDDLVDRITVRTWRYARRQLGWFERDPRIDWTDADAIVAAWG